MPAAAGCVGVARVGGEGEGGEPGCKGGGEQLAGEEYGAIARRCMRRLGDGRSCTVAAFWIWGGWLLWQRASTCWADAAMVGRDDGGGECMH